MSDKSVIPFEDMVWLFQNGPATRGRCRLNIEEAAYMYRHIKTLNSPCCIEIGRYQGGSTRLLLAAGARVISIDNHAKDGHLLNVNDTHNLCDYDIELYKWACDNGCKDSLKIVVGDASTYEHRLLLAADVLFFDGGHSYEAVKADFEHWFGRVPKGGDLFWHDICTEGVRRFVDEVGDVLEDIKTVSTLKHCRKRSA